MAGGMQPPFSEKAHLQQESGQRMDASYLSSRLSGKPPKVFLTRRTQFSVMPPQSSSLLLFSKAGNAVMRRTCKCALEMRRQRVNGLCSSYETVWICSAHRGECFSWRPLVKVLCIEFQLTVTLRISATYSPILLSSISSVLLHVLDLVVHSTF
jgi:hypothetical protein